MGDLRCRPRSLEYPEILQQDSRDGWSYVISQVAATTFHRFLGNGRTSPAIFTCEGPSHADPNEFVVKLKGGIERRERGLLYELYASLLASHLGIECPQPAVVSIDEDLARLVQDQLAGDPRRAQIIGDSIGLNFGSQFLVNLTVWPVDKGITQLMLEPALKVFAFDALIQNPDRAFNNPNLGSRGDELFVFDHEMAFSFLLNILPNQTPWRLEHETYLDRHVFARKLRGVPFPADFSQLLRMLTPDVLGQLALEIPDEWQCEDLQKIEAHIGLIRDHADEFAEEVRRRLG
jgi:hypothetical protein